MPPYEFDITSLLRPGKNLLTFNIYNILANKLTQKPGGIRDGLVLKEYGLFGPVRIIPYSYLTFTY